MESWHKLLIEESDASQKEIMSAMLMFNGAESVIDQESNLEVYLDSENLDSIISFIKNQEIFDGIKYEINPVVNQNWNSVWESNFDPIDVNDIHIRASFHPPTQKQEIIIQPKMAFGTGHHETTFMMIEKMSSIDFKNKTVLDYGCGTGILAVYADMQNSISIDAIDIQPEAVENTIEHFEVNNRSTNNLIVKEGDLNVLSRQKYDIILANINRHVLLDNVVNLKDRLSSNGTLLMSGILLSDRKLIIEKYTAIGFELVSETQKGEWCLFEFELSN